MSIFLIAVGALLAFAVDYQVWWLDITVAGWVLMVVGALGLLLTLLLWGLRRDTTHGSDVPHTSDTLHSRDPHRDGPGAGH